MENSSGLIEVDLFGGEVNHPEHPEAAGFKRLLEEVAEDFDCHLTHFDVKAGTVSFSFDSDELMAEILKILEEKG